MKPVARINDPSDHGGHILTAASTVKVNGREIARDGDLHYCPTHGVTALHASSTNYAVEGKFVVRVGDTAGCGARITRGSQNDLA